MWSIYTQEMLKKKVTDVSLYVAAPMIGLS